MNRVLKILTLLTLCAFLVLLARENHSASSPPPENIRQALLASALTNDPDLSPDGVGLTHFSHVCELSTDDGETIYVSDRRAVILGMQAPRGLNFITFFAEDFSYLGKFRYLFARPLWCDGGKLFLFGGLDAGDVASDSNVIDVSGGFQNIRFYHEEAYGSG